MTKSLIIQLKPLLKDGNHLLWKSIEHTFNCLTPTQDMKYSYNDYYSALKDYMINNKSWCVIGLSMGMSENSGKVNLPKRIERYISLCNDVTM